MAKYSYEFKIKVVQEYLCGGGGYKYLADKYNIASKTCIEEWVATYNEFGFDGLIRKRKNETYSFDFKLHVVKLYLTTEVSYRDLALSVGMNNPPLITKWVNDYRLAGPDALKPKQKGRRPKVDKPKDTNLDKSKETNIDTEYLK